MVYYVIKVIGNVIVNGVKMGELIQYFSPLSQSLVSSPEDTMNAYYSSEEVEELIATESRNWEVTLRQTQPSFHVKQWRITRVTVLVEDI